MDEKSTETYCAWLSRVAALKRGSNSIVTDETNLYFLFSSTTRMESPASRQCYSWCARWIHNVTETIQIQTIEHPLFSPICSFCSFLFIIFHSGVLLTPHYNTKRVSSLCTTKTAADYLPKEDSPGISTGSSSFSPVWTRGPTPSIAC